MLRSWLRKLANRKSSKALQERRRSRALRVEALEERALMAASVLPGEVSSLLWQGVPSRVMAGEWVVRVNGLTGAARATETALQSELGRAGLANFQVKHHLGADGLFLIQAPTTLGAQNLQANLTRLPGFVSAEPNFVVQAARTPNDTRYGELYGLHNTGQNGGTADADIDAPEAWDLSTGSANVVVGVIDSGIAYTHPDLAANMWRNPGEIAGNGLDDDGNGFKDDVHGCNFITFNDAQRLCGDPMDNNGHGTHVAGTIGAMGNNGQGVVGVSWNVRLMALKFLDAQGNGTTANAIRAINYATMMRGRGVNLQVTNNSWGGGGYSQQLRDAIQASGNAGILFVAAAGNGGVDGVGDNNDTTPHYPASYNLPNLLAVAATDNRDARAGFSNYGATTVHLGAPGVAILSTVPTSVDASGYRALSGTSMATPHVAGTAALASAYVPHATMPQIRAAILSNVDPVTALQNRTTSGGRLNVSRTLRALPIRSASFERQSVPALMTAGQTHSVSVTLRNTGNVIWTTAAGYYLGAQNPMDNTHWGANRVALPSDVAPNQQVTFNFTVRAPATPNVYNFQWQMLQSGVAWFGQASTNVAITAAIAGDIAFVGRAYQDILQRGVDAPAQQFYANYLTVRRAQGGDVAAARADISTSLVTSREYRERLISCVCPVQGYYQKFLPGQTPTPAEIDFYADALEQGATEEDIQAAFLASAGYYGRHGSTDAGFIRSLYEDVLNRPASEEDVQGWLEYMHLGRHTVAMSVLSSWEYQYKLVGGYYERFLDRTATDADIQYYIDALNQGTRPHDVIAAFVASEEYYYGQ